MKILNWIKKNLAALAAASAISFGSGCANPVSLGSNNLQYSVNTENQQQLRAFNNIDVKAGQAVIGYHGFNQCYEMDSDTYFGKHPFTFGYSKCPVRAEVCIKTNSHGTLDQKFGIRDTSLCRKLKGFGFFEVLANEDAASCALYYGKPFGRNLLELTQTLDMPYEGDTKANTEVQFSRNFNTHLAGFVRAEFSDFDLSEAKYRIGITLKNK